MPFFNFRPAARSVASLAVPLALALLTTVAGCDRPKPQAQKPTPVEVTVIEAKPVTAPLNVDGIGHVFAVRTVSVRSQVTGVLQKTLFAEGDVVKEGQLLLIINPDSYKAKLDEAKSTLARDKATAAQAKREWLRYKDLVAKAVISQEDYEQKRTAWQQDEEQVKVDEAAVVNAKVNLDYCYIYAPCTGVVGLQQYKTGNLIEANKDIIVSLNQIEPINVQFSVAEKYLPDIRSHAAKATLAVEAHYPGQQEVAAKGTLNVINNTVDTSTGTITLQGVFPNTDRALWPGQFVDATVVLADTVDTLLVPSSAVANTQSGVSLFIAKPDNTVEIRPVTAGRKIGAETVIEKGLAPGERVITSGQIKLFPGVPLTIVQSAAYKEGPVSPAAVADRDKNKAKPSGEGQGN
ncbi:efflux RND transporter periplasmic adaptor subunit [Desulfovibrio sp. TomC]|uniref:efflux RND transporter periplasmic adaptor subunit n=1 Tax=Desulfovibrio sp. TomC TaxID=1562888 RepID=UPI0005741338|nr:efflux RND transporter periplasmic adaptor subunit [Desulfovibrio sp. TomC]KHK01201.1 efflux transporter, RND family, MFP subunit [Desulfovibrio sp. TomC]